MQSKEDEITLITLFQKGDPKAFRSLFVMYFKQLSFYAEGIVGNKQEAEDLATEAFIKLLRLRPEFESLSKLKSFLFSIVHNAAIDLLKAQSRHSAAHEQIGYLMENQDSAELLLIQSEVIKVIHEEIEQLPSQCRQIVKSIFIDGNSVKEIAEKMGLAYQTVLNQKNRGIQLLKTAILKNNLLLYPLLWLAHLFLNKFL